MKREAAGNHLFRRLGRDIVKFRGGLRRLSGQRWLADETAPGTVPPSAGASRQVGP